MDVSLPRHFVYNFFKASTQLTTILASVPLFAASSVLLCNDFVTLYGCSGSESLISNALMVLDACDKRHNLVSKAWFPLVSFKSIVFDQRRVLASNSGPGHHQGAQFSTFKVEEVSGNLYETRCFDTQDMTPGESLDLESFYRVPSRHGTSEWSGSVDCDTRSRRQSLQSVQTGSDYLRNTSISPGLSHDFEIPWTDEVPNSAAGWTQLQGITNANQIHLPIPLMTLPSSTLQEHGAEYEEDFTGEGDN